MKKVVIKLFCMFTIVVTIIIYNMKVNLKEKDDEIAKLNASLLSKEQTIENIKEKYNIVDNKPEDDKYIDGTYEGVAKGFGGDIKLAVEIKNGAINNVELLSAKDEDKAFLNMAMAIIDDILANNTSEVDTVSGATFSSNGIKNAVKQALESAIKTE